MMKAIPDWYKEVYDTLRRSGIDTFCYVPDAGVDPFLKLADADPDVRQVVLTTEEEGVAICSGLALAGKRGVLLTQSSGVGNCINTFSFTNSCRLPMLVLVSMRGEFGETVPWQVPMGRITQQCLELIGFTVLRAIRADEVADLVRGAAQMAWRSEERVAVLLSQRLIGAKDV
jgi:sulfopyruvate decarboxylase alpha subunit